jgi:hypothetical protein
MVKSNLLENKWSSKIMKLFLKTHLTTSIFAKLVLAMAVVSCVPTTTNLRSRSIAASNVTVATGQGYVLRDNPIILSSNPSLSPTANLNGYVSVANITTNAFLTGGSFCYGLEYCFEVRDVAGTTIPLQTQTGKWNFNTSSTEFLETNTYYHINKIFAQFFSDLDFAFGTAYNFSIPNYETSLPMAKIMGTSNYYLDMLTPLVAYANCSDIDNSYYSRAENSLCFGQISTDTSMKWAQDSTVIYHEVGHYIQHMLLNLRNNVGTKTVGMGNFNYDEVGAIGEGLSDYFSYYINQRAHFSEWAAGRTLASSRPLSEDDALHIPNLAKEVDKRLSYPDYLTYNPNYHTVPVEDVHYAGMIISHYLVALTEDLVDKCSFSKRDAQTQVASLLSNTLAELGDLSTIGTTSATNTSGTVGKVNLNTTHASDWIMKNNPINYRSFSQTFAKYLLHTLGNSSLNLCNGGIYSRDYIESLLDNYGLLLFRTYNENKNFANPLISGKTNTEVAPANRNKSVLISKDQIILDPTSGASSAYIIDDRDKISSGYASMLSAGSVVALAPNTSTSFGYNNGNGRVSPGEVVGLALNLYNNSNSTMGGVQVLASDWKTLSSSGKPCIYDSTMSNDSSWTTASEGGESCSTVTGADADFAPFCIMQYNGPTATTWVSQSSFRNKIALDKSLCLDPSTEKDCFIRTIKGADSAYFSKIDPKKNWFQTMQNPNESSSAYSLSWGNLILLEVSKQVPPGTTVDCRFRVRFTNCEDCYHDSSRSNYDFLDTDYNGPKPFKIIHLQMKIVD